jgi:hypothetical protein
VVTRRCAPGEQDPAEGEEVRRDQTKTVQMPVGEMLNIIARLRKIYARAPARDLRESLRILEAYVDESPGR